MLHIARLAVVSSVFAVAACQPQDLPTAAQVLQAPDAGAEDDLDTDATIAQNASPAEVAAYIAKAMKPSQGLALRDQADQEMDWGTESPEMADASVLAAAWNSSKMVEPTSYAAEELQAAFAMAREARFLSDVDGNARRVSWLYPDDGCFTRAVMVNKIVNERLGLEKATHVFSFGSKDVESGKTFKNDLTVTTTNSPAGHVSWWYHVAPVVSVDGTSYVIDIAVNPDRPMVLEEWLAAQTALGGNVGASVVCDANAYVPGSKCVGGKDKTAAATKLQQGKYLALEWNRMIKLERIARDVLLGDNFQP